MRFQAAEAHFFKFHYQGLRQALALYGELLDFPAFRNQTGERYLQTALLLALREKEMGIMTSTVLSQAAAEIDRNPYLEGMRKYIEIVDRIPAKTKGITGGSRAEASDLDDYLDWVKDNVEPLNAHLKEKSTSSDLFAYLFIAFNSAFAYKFPEPEDLTPYAERFSGSPLIKFKLAIHPNLDYEALNEIIRAEPEFYEADLFIGDVELHRGHVLSAEKRYLNAFQHIPNSTSLVISLANVCFHMEEFERCLEFNDQALALVPTYRDAILGKAMSLGYLGRHEEALAELGKMMELGNYYIGESYYWTAWNLNQMGRIDEAQIQVELAKNYLIGHHEVMSLAGLVAYQQGRHDDAEQDLLEALELNPHECEASFYLGKIYADRLEWSESGRFFERSATCNQRTENTLNARIQEIEESSMSPARKKKHIRNKKAQLLQARRTRATAEYNAAAGYYNAKMMEPALRMAEKAVAYPATQEMAMELITAIKQK
jgi:tetratricopeptide (TPR) repeat protein